MSQVKIEPGTRVETHLPASGPSGTVQVRGRPLVVREVVMNGAEGSVDLRLQDGAVIRLKPPPPKLEERVRRALEPAGVGFGPSEEEKRALVQEVSDVDDIRLVAELVVDSWSRRCNLTVVEDALVSHVMHYRGQPNARPDAETLARRIRAGELDPNGDLP